MNANIMRTQIIHKIKYALIFFTFRSSDLMTTLTYVLMDNFCPCFALKLRKLRLRNYKLTLCQEELTKACIRYKRLLVDQVGLKL